MLMRTHIALAVFFILLFLPHVGSKFVFVGVALIASVLPDMDTGFSTLGRLKGLRLLHLFVRHRGFIHSITFCVAISLIFAVFLPVIALPFFLGYSIHLFADSFTLEGIMPFWPYRKKSLWRFKTGSLMETSMFVFLVFIDVFLAVLFVK